tara:strand:- start:1619 stop:1804 length:186 start_codon:yes stop_codon:yes gene_type:complete
MLNWLKKTACYKRFVENVEDESQELSERAAPPILSPKETFNGQLPDRAVKWVTRRFKQSNE